MDKLNHPIDATFTFKFKPCIKNVFPLKYVFDFMFEGSLFYLFRPNTIDILSL